MWHKTLWTLRFSKMDQTGHMENSKMNMLTQKMTSQTSSPVHLRGYLQYHHKEVELGGLREAEKADEIRDIIPILGARLPTLFNLRILILSLMPSLLWLRQAEHSPSGAPPIQPSSTLSYTALWKPFYGPSSLVFSGSLNQKYLHLLPSLHLRARQF